jgi:large subunit ribosomal protein L21
MKYAVIRLGGKQFKVSEGDKLEIERQATPLQSEVLLYVDEKDVVIGAPVIEKAVVDAEVIEEKMGEKVRVVRFKSKSRYRKVKGHRQPLSVVEIKKISLSGAKTSSTKVQAEKPPAKAVAAESKGKKKATAKKTDTAKKTSKPRKSTSKTKKGTSGK